MDFLNHSNRTFIQLCSVREHGTAMEYRVSFQSQVNRSFAQLHNSLQSYQEDHFIKMHRLAVSKGDSTIGLSISRFLKLIKTKIRRLSGFRKRFIEYNHPPDGYNEKRCIMFSPQLRQSTRHPSITEGNGHSNLRPRSLIGQVIVQNLLYEA